MSWGRVFSAWSRLSRLNGCPRCGHTWYARGHSRSRVCPACRQPLGVPVAPSGPSSGAGAGCLIALATVGFIIFASAFIGATAAALGEAAIPVDAGIGAAIVTGVVVVRGRMRRARELAAAAQERDRRTREQYALAQAEQQRAAYWQTLVAQYGEAAAGAIMQRRLWQGATQAMVLEMLGQPVDTSRRVYKTKTKEVWKYHQVDSRRFGLTVTFENGVCVGWSEKD